MVAIIGQNEAREHRPSAYSKAVGRQIVVIDADPGISV
jgi:hypothetical protein